MRLKIPERYKGVVRSIRRKAKRNKIALRFSFTKTVHQDDDDIEGSGGYFGGGELAVAIDKPFDDWIPILLHESCHMDQFCDKRLVKKHKDKEWQSAYDGFYTWLYGKAEYSDAELSKMVDLIIECEKDCDQRALEKIKKWKLPINIKLYIQQSNTYLFSYHLIKDTRKWYPQLYMDDQLYTKAPDHYNCDYSTIPLPLMKAFYNFINKQELMRA